MYTTGSYVVSTALPDLIRQRYDFLGCVLFRSNFLSFTNSDFGGIVFQIILEIVSFIYVSLK